MMPNSMADIHVVTGYCVRHLHVNADEIWGGIVEPVRTYG